MPKQRSGRSEAGGRASGAIESLVRQPQAPGPASKPAPMNTSGDRLPESRVRARPKTGPTSRPAAIWARRSGPRTGAPGRADPSAHVLPTAAGMAQKCGSRSGRAQLSPRRALPQSWAPPPGHRCPAWAAGLQETPTQGHSRTHGAPQPRSGPCPLTMLQPAAAPLDRGALPHPLDPPRHRDARRAHPTTTAQPIVPRCARGGLLHAIVESRAKSGRSSFRSKGVFLQIGGYGMSRIAVLGSVSRRRPRRR
jgi:hypothetical protein